MRFLTQGDKSDKSILLIHGMANTSDLFDPLLPYLSLIVVIIAGVVLSVVVSNIATKVFKLEK